MKIFGTAGVICLVFLGGIGGCEQGQIELAGAPNAWPTATLAADNLSDSGDQEPASKADKNRSKQREQRSGDVRVLFIGNSHSAPIPRLLTRLFQKQQPKTKTHFQTARSFGFLADHAEVPATLKLIQSGDWDFVVLQAQKYSTSGKYIYPTDGALKLSQVANEANVKIIMYPEWSRAGVPDEYERIKAIHDKIAKQTGAKVAPIGEAWIEAAKTIDPRRLYAPDGNHATEKGSYLNACVFYAMITNERPNSKAGSSSAETRALEQAAWSAYEASRGNAQSNEDR